MERVGGALNDRSSAAMCDYSLHHVASRPATVGDKLMSTNFSNSITGGFASVEEPNVAVCLLPGTEVAFESEVQRKITRFQLSKDPEYIRHKVARFRQVNLENPYAHHDALEFPDGQIVLLTHLSVGQHASVLQLPAQGKLPAETEARRVAYID
jgi:hypothetical protein